MNESEPVSGCFSRKSPTPTRSNEQAAMSRATAAAAAANVVNVGTQSINQSDRIKDNGVCSKRRCRVLAYLHFPLFQKSLVYIRLSANTAIKTWGLRSRFAKTKSTTNISSDSMPLVCMHANDRSTLHRASGGIPIYLTYQASSFPSKATAYLD